MGAERGSRERTDRGAVYIAPDRVYQLVTDGHASLIRIEGKVDSIDRSVNLQLEAIKTDVDKLGTRVTPLEHRVWALPSMAGLIGAAALVLTIIQMAGAA